MTVGVFVPSRGRFTEAAIRSGPLPLIPEHLLTDTWVVVPVEEKGSYQIGLRRAGFEHTGLRMYTMHYQGIAEKRARIGHIAADKRYDKFLMLDDDINFLRRASPESASQVTMHINDKQNLSLMFTTVEHTLQDYPQVALGLREVNHTEVLGPPPLLEECGKAIRAVGWDTAVFNGLVHRRVQCMEDYEYTLQLLEAGHKNAVLWYWMSGQRSTNAPGGCSSWRTPEVHNAAAMEVHRLHPHVTRLRTKQTKSGGALSERIELTVQWKKAHRSGRHEQRSEDSGSRDGDGGSSGGAPQAGGGEQEAQ